MCISSSPKLKRVTQAAKVGSKKCNNVCHLHCIFFEPKQVIDTGISCNQVEKGLLVVEQQFVYQQPLHNKLWVIWKWTTL